MLQVRKVKCRPWLPDADAVARIIAAENEKDDEFGSVRDRRKTARRAARQQGHDLHPWAFQGSRRWTSYCATCMTIIIVDDRGVNFGGYAQCEPCRLDVTGEE